MKEHQNEMKKTIAHQKVISANKGGAQFDIKLTNKQLNPLIDTKCFNPIPITPYINYMGGTIGSPTAGSTNTNNNTTTTIKTKLQKRYIPVPVKDYFHRTSNEIRKPDNECLKQKQKIAGTGTGAAGSNASATTTATATSKEEAIASQLYINKVKQIMFTKYKYYNWCNDCMGTNSQLQL